VTTRELADEVAALRREVEELRLRVQVLEAQRWWPPSPHMPLGPVTCSVTTPSPPGMEVCA